MFVSLKARGEILGFFLLFSLDSLYFSLFSESKTSFPPRKGYLKSYSKCLDLPFYIVRKSTLKMLIVFL